jgi:signal transduction histidine kinase
METINSPIHVRKSVVREVLNWWLEPRSTQRDEAFRERSIRITLGVTSTLILLSFLLSILAFHDRWEIISFPTLHIYMLVFCLASAYALSRGRIVAAGAFHIVTWLVGASVIAILAGRGGSVSGFLISLPIFMLAALVTALVLPRNMIMPFSLIGAALFSLIRVGLQVAGVDLPGLDAIQSALNALVLLLAGGAFLNRLRVEFDSRLEAMRESMHQAEVARQQAEADRLRAEKADKAKSQFLANMSHELRTPLNAIIGYDEAMLSGMLGEFSPDQSKVLGHIQHNSRRLLTLIDDVLDLAKIESGALQFYLTPISPHKIITDVIESTRSLALRQNIELVETFADSVPEIVLSDAKKLQQILTNLISNAIKFTSQGGVTVEATGVDNQDWQFKVRDTGIGMPPDALSYIFEPFRQVDGADTRKYKGTGLGLSITKHLVDGLGGTISVETELGKGSTFTVRLPRAKTVEKAVVPQSA